MDDPGMERTVAKVSIVTILGDRSVRVVILVIFVVMLGFGIVAPILPLFAKSFGVDYGAVGLLVSSFAFTRLVFDLVAGPIIDRFGERATATAGLLFVALSSVATGLAPTFTQAVIYRGAGGAGSAVLFAALYSYLLKVVPKARMARTLGVFYGAFNVGVVAGAPIGGAVAHWFGLASPLFVYGGILIVSAALYFRLVPDPVLDSRSGRLGGDPQPSASFLRRTGSRIGDLMRNRAFLVTIFANFAYLWFVAGPIDTLIPLFGRFELGMSPGAIGWSLTPLLITELLVLYHAGSLSDRLGRKAVLVPSMLALAVMIAVLGWSPTVLVFVILLAVTGFASGYAGVPPGAMLADVVPERGMGTAVGVFRFAGDLGFVFGPLVAGWATDALDFRGAFAVSALPLALCVLLALRIPETLRRPSAG